jgi:hypothetical protein
MLATEIDKDLVFTIARAFTPILLFQSLTIQRQTTI